MNYPKLWSSDVNLSYRTPLSDTRSDNESLNAESIVGLEPGHQALDLMMRKEWHVYIHQVMLTVIAPHCLTFVVAAMDMSVMTSALA